MKSVNRTKTFPKLDKQFTIEIAVVVILLGIGAWLYFSGALNKVPKSTSYALPGDCLILEQRYCDEARLYTIDAEGTNGAGVNLPPGTPIYMPFDGAYFDETAVGDLNRTMKLGIVDTTVFVVVTGEYTPLPEEAATFVKKGDVLAIIEQDNSAQGEVNLVIYGVDYEISDLFQ